MKISVFLLFLLATTCSNNINNKQATEIPDADSVIIIHPDFPVVNDTLRLSQIVDSLFYIFLERTDQCKITEIRKIAVADSFLFVQDRTNKLYMFRKNGTYLCQITENCYGFDVLENSHLLYIAQPKGKFLVYDYLKNIIIKKIFLGLQMEWMGDYFAAIDTNTLAISFWNIGINQNRLAIVDMEGSVIKEFPNPEKFQSPNLYLVNATHFNRTFSRCGGQVRYHPYYSDTLYSISDQFRLEPVFVEQKIFKVPLQHRLEYLGNYEEFSAYCRGAEAYATRFYESARYTLVIYNLGCINQTFQNYLLFDKLTTKLYNYKQDIRFETKNLHFGIYNDYDGGLPFNPDFLSNEYLIETFDPKLFKSRYLNGRDLTSCKDPDKCIVIHYEVKSNRFSSLARKKNIEHFINEIQDDGNPILIVAQLKRK